MPGAARAHLLAVLLVLGGLAGWRFGGYSGVDRIGEIAVWAVFAMSLDLIAGFAGLVSLGHALYFGLAAYAMAGLTLQLHWPPSAALVPAVAAAGLAAWLTGLLVVRLRGVFFIMITLALGQMGWAYVLRSPRFGGEGGMSGIPQFDLAAFGLSLADPRDFALLAIIAAALVYAILAWLVAAPFGRMLLAIDHNETRARALGLAVPRYKLAAFTIAGAVAGLAGTLAAERTQFVSPDLMVWTTSGEALIMVIVGGRGSLAGAALGAAIWVLLRHAFSGMTNYWMLPMGLVFVGIVLFADAGVFGLIRRRRAGDA